jgi:mannose-6-phosphate isomerase-like protein (cupin superfamily)
MEIDKVSAQILRAAMGDDPAPKPQSTKNDDPASADHWTPAILLERSKHLQELARAGKGEAGETLREYPQHRILLSFRARNGEVEIHEKWADVFLVLSGSGTLVTGGTVQGARITAPGETRGDSIEGGKPQELRQGDIAHVPAGTPHQFLVSGDKTVTSMVFKIRESQ